MRIFPPELVIGEKEGFAPDKDIFGRSKLGDGLTNLVSSVDEPMVVAIDAQWGAGKTAFLKMWAGELRKAGFPVIYYDSYYNDFAEDAFTSLASEIFALIEQKKKETTPAAHVFMEKAAGAGKILLRSSLRLGVKVATLNVVDTKDFEDAAEAVAEELSELTDKYVGELLTRQKEQAETFKAFRQALSDLPSLLLPEGDGQVPSKPLVIIIDELDRCRPSYALELLERIKHFFSVPNVHFVLGAHMGQLQNSVVAAYGTGIDAQTYLQKFVHVTLHLVDQSRSKHERVINKYVSYLSRTLDFGDKNAETLRYTAEFIEDIAHSRGLSLRAVERIMTNLALALAFTGPNYFRPPPILAGLCVIKVVDPALYQDAKLGRLTYSAAATVLGLPNPPLRDAREEEFDTRWWRYCLDPSVSDEFVAEMQKGLFRYSLYDGREGLVPLVANEILDRLTPAD